MTTVLISGATGLVGRFIAEAFMGAGDEVIVMERARPKEDFFSQPVAWVAGDLDPDRDCSPAFNGVDLFVHCAFDHVAGKYRGGEGNDPAGFKRSNIDGTLALMQAAQTAGVARAVFLSSRAVYGPKEHGVVLTEETECLPDTLYGETKLSVEYTLSKMATERFLPIILRVTGVYGPTGSARNHKWHDLFNAFKNGETITPRAGTEVHGNDVAAAVCLLATYPRPDLESFGAAPVFNVSDIILDRHDLIKAYGEQAGRDGCLPERADTLALNVMDCTRLRSLGWIPRGRLDIEGMI